MTIRYEIAERVAVLTINRPGALNALDLATLRALRECLRDARDRDDVGAVVLTGMGTRAFCVGSDLKGTATSAASYAGALFHSPEASADMGLYIRLMDLADLQLHKPLVAAINGHCLGGGLELALQCDLRLAADNASFGLPEAALGSIPAVSGLHRLLKAIPSALAMQMALTGERIDAAAALQCGLVSEICTGAALAARAFELATRIARNAPLAVQAIQKLSRQTAHLSQADAQQLTELYWGVLRDTDDRAEGRRAFVEKRPPVYVGR